MSRQTILSFFCLYLALRCSAHSEIPRAAAQCQPLHTTFPASAVYAYNANGAPAAGQFAAVSPEGSYQAGNGLQLFLQKPAGVITKKNGVNDKIAAGATINSTFTMLYGKVSYEVSSPVVAGIVTAVILIADEHDEIDIEILGGDVHHWQTNVYAPASATEPPMWGFLGSVESIPNGGTIAESHTYAIDWSASRIIWSIDGKAVRTLTPEQTRKNGVLHYPSHAARLQLGIWDASSPAGTAEWAKGPVDWSKAPEKMTALVRSVTVEC
ncbi:glycoside hydrolase family 16 protein [Plicaturopsis crispa FD-325 SS-3]|nr:glycoside hydrolase family 16 protein [Plicaturopsis crispa FD-325 SS-3]